MTIPCYLTRGFSPKIRGVFSLDLKNVIELASNKFLADSVLEVKAELH